MPTKRADDTAGTEAEAPAAVANDTDDLVQDLATTQELVLRQEELIRQLAEKVEALEGSQTAAEDLDVPDPADFVPAAVPEGHRRYASRFTELTLIKTAGKKILVNGEVVFVPADRIDFTGGVFQTMEYQGETPIPELIEWMESHSDFNQTFWVDDYAIRRHSTVEIQVGVKSSNAPNVPRAPLVAPMQ